MTSGVCRKKLPPSALVGWPSKLVSRPGSKLARAQWLELSAITTEHMLVDCTCGKIRLCK